MATAPEPTLLDRLEEQRTKLHEDWAELVNQRETERAEFEERTNSEEFKALQDEARDTEITAFRAAEEAFKAENERRKLAFEEMDERVNDQREIHRRREEAEQASRSPKLSIGREELTYDWHKARGLDGLSYYRDVAMVHGPAVSFRTGGTRDQAQARLIRHGQEMDVEMPKRAKEREARAMLQFHEAEQEFYEKNAKSLFDRGIRSQEIERIMHEARNGLSYSPFERRVEPNVAQGQGGYFVPPLWLVDQFIPGLRAHLVAAGLFRQMDLPAGTDSINIPKLNTLTLVGYQQMNNSGLPSQDFTDIAVTANVKTIGGYADIGLQLLEQSPYGIVDEVVTMDLMAAYNKFLDAEVIAGDALAAATLNGGHLTGIYPSTNWSGTNSVTYTDGSPSGQHFVDVFGCMASNIAKTRFSLENLKFIVHGRRWFWYSTSKDANGRPLGETPSGGRYNIAAAIEAGTQAEGLVGTLPSVADAPVYIDNNISTSDTTGGGSGQDYAIGGLFDDAWLFTSALRTDVFREVLSGSLGVRFRVYNYAASLLRYGQSFAVATGSGFAAPQGAVSSLTF